MAEHTAAHCNSERLRLLLANELPAEREAETTEHVAACEQCQRELEALAADPRWWDEVQTSLRNLASPDSQPLAATTGPDGADPADSHHAFSSDCESFAADFAVDFLDPCPLPGTLGRLGDIEIQEVIGRGGMGIVLKGYQRELGRHVAVKVIAPHLAASGAARQRFAREARAAAAIVHPHVMAIHSVDSSGRLPYLVMPYLACESLQQRLDREGPLELKEVLRIARQTAAGLAAAHAQGLVHRDVKPANILLEKGVERAMLTDFGLARAVDDASLTRSGVIAGTPQFMSPEQARGDVLDPRTDLFSLGSVIYAMCTGRPPFRSETSFGVLRRITDSHARPIRDINPDIPDWLCSIVDRLHAKTPAERPGSAAQAAELFEQCLAHVQQPSLVPLPDAVQSAFAGSPMPNWRVNTTLVGKKPGIARWPRSMAPLTIASIVSILAGSAAIVALLAVLATQRIERLTISAPQSTPGGSESHEEWTAESVSGAATLRHPMWNDEVDTQMLELSADVDVFEQRAAQFWDTNDTQTFKENRP